MDELIEGLMTLTFHTPLDVAETILKAIQHKSPPLWLAGTLDAYLFEVLRRWLPAMLYHHLLYAGLPRIWHWGQAGQLAQPAPNHVDVAVATAHPTDPPSATRRLDNTIG
jgi:hypothetical protein